MNEILRLINGVLTSYCQLIEANVCMLSFQDVLAEGEIVVVGANGILTEDVIVDIFKVGSCAVQR